MDKKKAFATEVKRVYNKVVKELPDGAAKNDILAKLDVLLNDIYTLIDKPVKKTAANKKAAKKPVVKKACNKKS